MENWRQLARARDLLEARMDEPISLAEAAREAYLSPFHFHRLFVGKYGCTPHEFATSRRIEAAKRMLAEGEKSITEICFTLGYQSLGTFSDKFRRVVGCPPSEYRVAAARVFALSRHWRQRYVPGCFVEARIGQRAVRPPKTNRKIEEASGGAAHIPSVAK
jgi:AraC-like DNA-binding protein